ncbi:MAG: cation transporter, partial [Bacteroidales bacterium]|nr:cation transporter [Bacteroidales bacterium]
ESLRLSIDAVPEGIDPDQVKEAICECEGVSSVHHVHIWPISTTENALTAHVVINDVSRMHQIGEAIKEELTHRGISHSTLEMESEGSECDEQECGEHHHHHHDHDDD